MSYDPTIRPIQPDEVTSATLTEYFVMSPDMLFSDSGGSFTTPATLAGKVGSVKARAGRSETLIQTVSADQPTYNTDGTSLLPGIVGNGTSVFMNRSYKGAVGSVFVLYSLYYQNAAQTTWPICCTGGATAGTYHLTLHGFHAALAAGPGGASTGDGAMAVQSRSDSTGLYFAVNTAIPTADVLSWRSDGTNVQFDRYGKPCGPSTAMTGTAIAPDGANSVLMARYNTNTAAVDFWMNGTIMAFVTFSGKVSDAETAGLHQWMMRLAGMPRYSGKFLGVYFNSNGSNETGNSQSVIMVQSEDVINIKTRPSSMQPTSAGTLYRDFCPTYDPVTNAVYSSSTQGYSATTVPIFQCVDGRQWTYNGAHFTKPASTDLWATEFVRNQDGSIWKDTNGLPRLIFGYSTVSGGTPGTFTLKMISPVDTTWPTGGSWNAITSVTFATAPSDAIDPSVVYGSDGMFHMVFATRTGTGPGNSTIQYATASSLDGTWTITTGSTTAADPFNLGATWEGPQIIYRPKTNDYVLLVDKQGLNYFYTTSSTIGGFNATTKPLVKVGSIQHGNTIPLPPGWDY